MQTLLLLTLCAAAPFALADENPLGKVIQLMTELSAKVTSDGEAEQKAYQEYYEWCDGTSKNLENAITTATARKEKLEAKITELGSDIEVADSEIEKLASATAESDDDLKKATSVRADEAADFAEGEKELLGVIDTLDRALEILERESSKSGAALTQIDSSTMANILQSLSVVVDAATLSSTDRSKLLALVQSEDDEGEPGAPAATVFKNQDSGIVDLLGDLKDKSETQLSELRKAESESAHTYKMLRQSLEDQSAQDTKHLDGEKANKAGAEEGKAGAEGDLTTTVRELKDAKEELAETRATCMEVAADHEAGVKAREEELKVIAQAKKILVETSGGAAEQTYSLVQLAQTRTGAQTKVVGLVKKLAVREHSAALAQLASRISSVVRYGSGSSGPFKKVKELIVAMIGKLEVEGEADATEKAYCDEQMAKTEAKKGDLEDGEAKLTTKIDQDAAKSAELKEQVKVLQNDIATLVREQSEMDKMREEEHAEFLVAKADLELGLSGVRKAIGVLKDYYAKDDDDDAGSFAQQPAKPETFKKSEGGGSSIIGILEVVESDFAQGLAKEESQEADLVSTYEKNTQENKVAGATKGEDVKGQTQEFKALDTNIAELTADHEAVSTELDAVNEYYAKVQERCVAKPETYEERKKRRESEITGLKEALSVLSSEVALVQRKRRGNVRGSLAPM